MRATIGAVGLLVLAACSHSAEPVGENSEGSIKTTAVGTIVGTEPSPAATADAATNAVAPAATAVTANDTD